MIGLYSGRKINELANKKEKVTRTQTALNAQKQIIKKYGKVVESAKYLHKGKGNWVKYSLANDKKRTGKLTTDIKEWRRQPNKLDFKGIDTRGSKGKSEIAKKKVAKPQIKTTLSKDEREILKRVEKRRKRTVPTTKEELEKEIKTKQAMGGSIQLRLDREKEESGKAKVREWALTSAAQKITPKASFIVYDFLTGRYENTLKDIDNGKISKQQVYQILSKIRKYKALPNGIVANYTKKVRGFKPKNRFAISQLKHTSKPDRRTTKKIPSAHKPTLKTIPKKSTDSRVYMRSSPFTSLQIQAYNSFSHYDVDINREFNNTVERMERHVRKRYIDKIPPEVLKALANYRKSIYESYLEESRARRTAPSMMVVGPAGYKNFDRKIARANAIRNKSDQSVKYAEKQIDLAIKRSNIEREISAVKSSYGVNIGDNVMLYWTSSYRQYKAPAKVIKINVNTLIGKLLEEINGYPKGHEIKVPMHGTKGNRWTHINGQKKSPEQSKELASEFYETLKGKFKVGDRVYNTFYRFEGTVVKISKKTMVIKGNPTYKGDDGLRKVPIDEKHNKKL